MSRSKGSEQTKDARRSIEKARVESIKIGASKAAERFIVVVACEIGGGAGLEMEWENHGVPLSVCGLQWEMRPLLGGCRGFEGVHCGVRRGPSTDTWA